MNELAIAKFGIRVGFQLRISILLIGCMAGVAVPGRGQSGTSSAISGTVTDSSGALVANATVTAIETNTKAVRTGTTDANGHYLCLLGSRG
jgi:Carboxypeptidase regulatory-like domain